MMIRKTFITLGSLLAAAVLSTGCVVHERAYVRPHREVIVEQAPPPRQVVVVQQPAPVTVYAQPAPPPPPATPVIVEQAPPVSEQVLVVNSSPPPLYAEVRTRRPGPEFVWLSGYWIIHQNRWVWVHGHWERPPHPGAVWVGHHWDHVGASFHFSVGVWR